MATNLAAPAPAVKVKYSLFVSFGNRSGFGTGAVDLPEARKKILQAAKDFAHHDNLDFELTEVCENCEGRGYKKTGKGGIVIVNCVKCNGTGGTRIL
ncbi:MAG: hypothetical protein J0I20_33795 [Chloroflexi bacterium]|nr:hypothetical protein [Chloroflexota bacterium]OJW05565.1 MAG: hypothetical protein BGO39_02810 [Chloroflexi bacterium 54-19]